MMAYYELTTGERGIYGICAIVLLVIAIAILVDVWTSHLGHRYVLPAALLTVAVFCALQGMADVNHLMASGGSFTYFAKFIGNLPWGVVLLFLMIGFLLEILFMFVMFGRKKNRLTPSAIKEGLDALPDGVCFYSDDGQPLLVNTQMNRICGELFGTELLNANQFWDSLKNRETLHKEAVIHTEPTVFLRTVDGKLWDVHRNFLTIGHAEILELIAYDVTRQYELNGELDRRNKQLARVNERLRLYSREVEQVTTDSEILAAKLQVHDNVGRSLLAFRSYLAQPETERDREELLLLWRYTIEILKNEADSVGQQDELELLFKAAQAVDVEIVQTGELPEDEKQKKIIISALHECLTNTVKHANGNKLYVTVQNGEHSVIAVITNNGIPPTGKIKETGGLKNLRRRVERAGGSLTIDSTPRFVLRVELPRGGE